MGKGKGKGYGGKTSTTRPENEQALGQEDNFRRLPAELLVCILTIVADLKSLFKCSLVSKHFASVVSRVQSVCVTIPRRENYCDEHYKSLDMIPPAPLVFLKKFRELESIYLEYNYMDDSNYSSVIKWKVKFSTNFPNIEKFVAFLSVSAQKQGGEEPHQEQVSDRENRIFTMSKTMDFSWLSQGCGHYAEWIFVIYMLAKSHVSLKRVIITDSDKKGKMVIGDEQLVRIRSVHKPGERLFQFPHGVESFKTPVLKLPLSGYVMKHANLIIFTCPTETNARAIDEIVSWDFEDEGKVFGEAIKEIYKNHRDEFRYKKIPISTRVW